MHLHCASCAAKVERVVMDIPGVEKVATDVGASGVTVTGTADAAAVATSVQIRTRRPVTVVRDGRSGARDRERSAAAAGTPREDQLACAREIDGRAGEAGPGPGEDGGAAGGGGNCWEAGAARTGRFRRTRCCIHDFDSRAGIVLVLNEKDGLLHPPGLPADHTAGGRVDGGGQDRRAGLLRQMHQQDRPARVAIPRGEGDQAHAAGPCNDKVQAQQQQRVRQPEDEPAASGTSSLKHYC
ncbi:uncharacterized protein C2845_PM01G41340 [Panicum miliaceum]|uniref:HMA domain-containing protein n=1 Tax=Panicum miliaceum TaxID=4540 RepID=A0A3L6TQR9_PANMI|nr:uncharacterized protein C2845_PM01G41340 [Panicum miliaceum]